MIWELFALTGFFFWVVWGLAGLLVIGCALNESPGWASFWVVAFGVFIFGFTDFTTGLSAIQILTYVAGYLAAGAFYAMVRWVVLVRQIRNRYDSMKELSLEEFNTRYKTGYGGSAPDHTAKNARIRDLLSSEFRTDRHKACPHHLRLASLRLV